MAIILVLRLALDDAHELGDLTLASCRLRFLLQLRDEFSDARRDAALDPLEAAGEKLPRRDTEDDLGA